MRRRNKIIAAAVVLAMLLGMLPLAAFAGGGSIISSIEIEDVTLMEGQTTIYMDENNDLHEEYRFEFYYSITLTDGRNVSGIFEYGEGDAVYIDGQPYWFVFNGDTQNIVDWVGGGVYTLNATMEGTTASFTVTVLENPIESITVDNMTVIENTKGHFETDSNDNQYYYYDLSPHITFHMKDGSTVETDDNTIAVSNEIFAVSISESQEIYHWYKGYTYAANVSIFGIAASFAVEIIPSPVASLTVDDMSIIEKMNGQNAYDYAGELYWRYNYIPEFTATLTDGSVVHSGGSLSVLVAGDFYDPTFYDSQEYHPWTVGNTYTVTAEFLGAVAEFHVSIIPSPVVTLTIKPVTVYDGADNHTDYDENYEPYSRYSYIPEYTAKLTGGVTVESQFGMVEIYGVTYRIEVSDNQHTSHWTTGRQYSFIGKLAGKTAVGIANVKANPVRYITAEDISVVDHFGGYRMPTAMGQQVYYYNLPASGVTVYFTDHTTAVPDPRGGIEYEGRTFYVTVREDSPEGMNNWEAGGTYPAAAWFFGKKASFSVTVLPNEYRSFVISGEKSLTLTFTKKDGKKEVLHAYDYFGGGIKRNTLPCTLFTLEGIKIDITVVYPYSTDSSFEFDDPFIIKCGDLTSVNTLYGCSFFLDPMGSPELLLGDTDGNGKFTSRDLANMKKYMAGSIDVTDDLLRNFDIDQDGKITSKDIAAMKKILAGANS